MANKFNLGARLKNFNQLKKDLPEVLANDAQRFFSKSFNNEGFTDSGLTKWKDPIRKTKGKGPASTRNTLVKSGRLRREVSDSIKSVSFDRTVLSVSAPYAQIHNEGGVIKRGNHSITMPKRKFMGHSKTLENDQLKKIKNAIKNVWK